MRRILHQIAERSSSITLALMFVAAVGLLLYLNYKGHNVEVMSSIGAGLIVSFTTIFVINRGIERREKSAWSGARSSVLRYIDDTLEQMLHSIGLLAELYAPAPDSDSTIDDDYLAQCKELRRKFYKEEFNRLLREKAESIKQSNWHSWNDCFSAIESYSHQIDTLLAAVPETSWTPDFLKAMVDLRCSVQRVVSVQRGQNSSAALSFGPLSHASTHYFRKLSDIDGALAFFAILSVTWSVLSIQELLDAFLSKSN